MPEPEVLEAQVGLHAPPVEEPPAPVAETPPPPEPPKPQEDVEGIKGALVAERRRRQELEQELAVARTPPKPATPDIPDVSDEEAEKIARRYELYTPQGLDLPRAKQIIADGRKETETVARRVAEQVIEPLKQTTSVQASRQNFVWAASQQDSDGQPLVEPQALAEVWATFPPELTANPEVAKVILKAAVGEAVIARKPRPKAPEREPVLSESPGGYRGHAYTMSNIEKKVAQSIGVKEADWEKGAKNYQPGVPNRLE